MTHRIEVNARTGETTQVDLTAEEIAQAAIQYAAWQVEETARLAQQALDDAKQAKFEEWLALSNTPLPAEENQ
jgi:hypothetical protein